MESLNYKICEKNGKKYTIECDEWLENRLVPALNDGILMQKYMEKYVNDVKNVAFESQDVKEIREKYEKREKISSEIIEKLQKDIEKNEINMKKIYETRLHLSEETINKLRNEIATAGDGRIADVRASYERELATLREIIASNTKQMGDVTDKVQTLTNLFSTSTKKGAAGEFIVEESLTKYYPHITCEKTSHIPQSGDLLAMLDDFKFMIEVKAMKRVKLEDINKFKRDSAVTHADGCLFVSLTSSIPQYGDFAIDFECEKPTIYICIKESENILHLAVEILRYLYKQRQNSTSVDETNKQHISYILNISYQSLTRLEESVSALRRIGNEYASQIENIDALVKYTVLNLNQFFGVYPDFKNGTVSMVTPEQIFAQIVRNGKTASQVHADDLYRAGITKHQLDAVGGIKAVRESAKALI